MTTRSTRRAGRHRARRGRRRGFPCRRRGRPVAVAGPLWPRLRPPADRRPGGRRAARQAVRAAAAARRVAPGALRRHGAARWRPAPPSATMRSPGGSAGARAPAVPKLSRPGGAVMRSAAAPRSGARGIAAGKRDGEGLRFGKMALEAVGLEGEASDDAEAGRRSPSHAPGHSVRVAAHQVAVAGQRPEREIGAVAVVAEVEDAREADRRVQFSSQFAPSRGARIR